MHSRAHLPLGGPAHALHQLVRVLLELDVLGSPVLQHGLPEQHVEHAVVEDGELAHDLGGGGRARQPHQRAARQRADTVRVRQRGLGLDQLRTR